VFVRVVKVLWLMFKCLVAYVWRRMTKAENQVQALDDDYRNWSKYVLSVFQADLTVSGRENIPAPGNRKLIVMSNHQSQLDIPALVASLDRRTGFVAKRELSRIPMLGYWMAQVGCVFIDRSDSRGAHLVLEKAAHGMGSNPLVVFPEGTRSKDGNFLPLKQGGCRLAVLADAVILPVLIQNSRNAVENRDYGVQGTIPVSLRFFPVLDTREIGEGKNALNKIKDYVNQCWLSPNDRT
jgi:1-acyl-sn-glycerol-3-phosphate acyltransferase